jgi:hypothetical protein
VAKHTKNDSVVLIEPVKWTIDNTDSLLYEGKYYKVFDFINNLLKEGNYSKDTRRTVTGYGLNLFYPNKVNDRVKY